MTTKNVLLALAATGLLAFGAAAPVYAEDPAPAGDGMKSEVPADPDSTMAPADAGQDPATDQGAADSKMDTGADAGAKDGGGDAPDAAPPPKDGGEKK
jgi:hypothetical protein